MTGSPLDHIDAGDVPTGAGHELFLQYRRGEIDAKTYYTMNAVISAGLCRNERPKFYFPMSDALKAYVHGRLSGNREFDEGIGKRLGGWASEIFLAHDFNQHSVEHYRWAIGYLREASLTREIEALENAISRFLSVPFPMEQFKSAQKVMELDARDRNRGRP